MQRTQDNKQLLSSLVMTISSKAADNLPDPTNPNPTNNDNDKVLEPPAFSTDAITGFTAPTNGGAVGTDVANMDAWGRRLGYCAYDYGSAAVTPTTGTGLIRGSTDSSPTDSWVAVVVVSAGPDGVINTQCPAANTAASGVAATGDDMVAARSYGEMISFGNTQIASSLSAMGGSSTNKLCRLGSDGKMICDIETDLINSNTANRFCRINASGILQCSTEANTCSPGQSSKWNGSSFECDNSFGEVPFGGITMWSGTVASIPPGYALCDGTSGTPDLRSRFVVAATSDASTGVIFNADSGAVSGTYKPGNFGGKVAHQLTVDQIPSHTHRMCQADEGVQSGGATVMDGFRSGNCFAPESVGGDDFHENRPPYYALAFIMRIGCANSTSWSVSCPSDQTGTLNYQCLNGVATRTSGACYYANCGSYAHEQDWTAASCPDPQKGTISYLCKNGNPIETGRACLTPYSCPEEYECVTSTHTCGWWYGTWNDDCYAVAGNLWEYCTNGSYANLNGVNVSVSCAPSYDGWGDFTLNYLGTCTTPKTCYQ
jgi:hypothetical protein